jgi:hypothetical protein
LFSACLLCGLWCSCLTNPSGVAKTRFEFDDLAWLVFLVMEQTTDSDDKLQLAHVWLRPLEFMTVAGTLCQFVYTKDTSSRTLRINGNDESRLQRHPSTKESIYRLNSC